MDCSPPGSSVHGISQTRMLEWVAISFSRRSSPPRDWTHISCISGQILYRRATREVLPSLEIYVFTDTYICVHACARAHTHTHTHIYIYAWASLMAQMVKNLPAMQETWVRFLDWKDPLEKRMVTHSGIIVWRVSWTKEPHRLQSMGLQRVGHDWATNTYTIYAHNHICHIVYVSFYLFRYISVSWVILGLAKAWFYHKITPP